jgi:hypothetical protein
MYVIRRVFKCKPRSTREAAALLVKSGKVYEEAGQRSPSRVYISGGTVPGPDDTVYMEWLAETLESPYRASNKLPEEVLTLGRALSEFVESSHVEFYEMFEPT